jgi:hypothetical protein
MNAKEQYERKLVSSSHNLLATGFDVSATQTALFANSVALDGSSDLFNGGTFVLKVTPDGIIHTFAGIPQDLLSGPFTEGFNHHRAGVTSNSITPMPGHLRKSREPRTLRTSRARIRGAR